MKDVIFKHEQIWSFSHSSSSVPPDITLSVSQGCNKYLQNFLKWLWLRNPCIHLCSWGSRSQCPSRTVAENNRLVLLYININKKHLFISSTWCRTSGQVGSFFKPPGPWRHMVHNQFSHSVTPLPLILYTWNIYQVLSVKMMSGTVWQFWPRLFMLVMKVVWIFLAAALLHQLGWL